MPEVCGHSAITTDSPPVRFFHSVSVTNGITGCSNRSNVSSAAANTAVVCESPSATCVLASSRYQSQNSSQVKWYSDSHARLNSSASVSSPTSGSVCSAAPLSSANRVALNSLVTKLRDARTSSSPTLRSPPG